MLSLALLTPLVLPTAPPADDVEAALDELIERTNEYSGFSIRYEIESSTGDRGTLAFDYAAPDHARVEFDGEPFGGYASTWATGDEVAFLIAADGEQTGYARLELPDWSSTALAVVAELFPGGDDDGLDPGPSFVFDLGFDEATDRVDFDVSLLAFGPRTEVLTWLRAWRSRPELAELLELTEDAIVMTHERFGATIPLATGIPSEAWLIGKDGVERRLRLSSLELDEPADDARFEIPARPADARDTTEEIRQVFTGLAAARTFRVVCIAQIDDALAKGRVKWNDAARDDARGVFRALHGGWLSEVAQPANASLVEWIEGYAGWLEAQLGAGRTTDELRAHVAETWSKLAERNALSLEGWLETLAQDEPPETSSNHLDELVELEAEVFAALYAEHVGEPARRAFDEATGAVLDD